ncbi:MAG: hypothetical protein HY764_03520 [Candidatus Portnoybacteria bacterium]|nr:hypothetical protein [Candidatus Portnoybacteria bacterium]
MKKVFVTLTVLSLMVLTAAPALAGHRPSRHQMPANDSDITINIDNEATVTNIVSVGAYTGGNTSKGDDGGDGGDSGEAEVEGAKGTATSGDGGDGGDGGNGGTITSGDADASAYIANVVNTNLTSVDACGCEEGEEEDGCGCEDPCGCQSRCGGSQQGDDCGCIDDIKVDIENKKTDVNNNAGVMADTGLNESKGDDGGNGGDSGEAEVEDQDKDRDNRWHRGGCNTCGSDSEDSECCPEATSGDAGDGGDGGNGGEITSGAAAATAKVFNLVNTTVTRVRR